MKKKTCLFALLILFFFIFTADTFSLAGQTGELGAKTLRGIKSIYVQTELIDTEVEWGQITAAQIRKETERQLEKARMKVLSEEKFDRLKQPRNYPLGRLDIVVRVKDLKKDDEKLYNITVRISQIVFLSRAPVIKLFAPTWESIAIGNMRNLDVVLDVVRDGVQAFINAYLSVNTK